MLTYHRKITKRPGRAATLTRSFLPVPDDRHFLQHDGQTRATKAGIVAGLGVTMNALAFDVDGAGHARSPRWDADFVAMAQDLPCSPFVYWTRGGARLVWEIPPTTVAGLDCWCQWVGTYRDLAVGIYRVSGIVCDPTCADPTRIFRAPHAARDGIPQVLGWVRGNPARVGLLDPSALAPESPWQHHCAKQAMLRKSREWCKVFAREHQEPPTIRAAVTTEAGARVRRAERYLERADAAIERQGGSAVLWRLARVVTGEMGLSADESLLASRAWNARCKPPWSDGELRRTFERAAESKRGAA